MTKEEEVNKRQYMRFVEEVLVPWDMEKLEEFHANSFDKRDGMGHLEQEGVELAREWNRIFHESFPDLEYVVEDLLAVGDKVIARATMRGTHSGTPFMGIPTTGRRFELETIDIVRMKDGLATEMWGVRDTWDLLRQLGAKPEFKLEAGD